MKTYRIFLSITFFLISGLLFSQEGDYVYDFSEKEKDKVLGDVRSDINSMTLSGGYGLNYAGYGIGLMYYPNKYFGLYGNLGFPRSNLTYVVGAKLRPFEKYSKNSHVYLLGQYGFNTLIYFEDLQGYDKVFNGFTLGVGFDWSAEFMRPAYFSTGILFPIRDGDAIGDYLDMLNTKYGIEVKDDLMPISFSFGINFPF